nr:MAG TPA: hypothetical protein [Caudoviricetes sp.]
MDELYSYIISVSIIIYALPLTVITNITNFHYLFN